MTYTPQPWQPVEQRRAGLWHNAAAVTLIGVLAGTGGDVNVEQVFKCFGTGSVSRSDHDSQQGGMQSLSFELKLIRSALRLSVAETAQLFGVSRPAIYSWQNGSSIRPKNAERLQAIANAITPHMALLEEQVGRVVHRAISGRTSLLQALAAGANADQAISQLAGILTREAAQRERLASRLRDRNGDRGAADLDALG